MVSLSPCQLQLSAHGVQSAAACCLYLQWFLAPRLPVCITVTPTTSTCLGCFWGGSMSAFVRLEKEHHKGCDLTVALHCSVSSNIWNLCRPVQMRHFSSHSAARPSPGGALAPEPPLSKSFARQHPRHPILVPAALRLYL